MEVGADETQVRSRRALLAAAAGGAAALAAQAALSPAAAMAADQPLLLNVPNAATASTELAAALETGSVLKVQNDAVGGGTALSAVAGPGVGILATATTGSGVVGRASLAPGRGMTGESPVTGTGVFGVAGEPTNGPSDTSFTGVCGYSDAGDNVDFWGSGVWGVSPDFGVYGSGDMVGVVGDGGTDATGLEGYSQNGYALYVTGKVKLANRSGKLSVAKGKTSVSKSVTGMSSSNIVIAVLQTSETGTWVRAAVAASGKFTVYFNRALPSSSSVGWIVLG